MNPMSLPNLLDLNAFAQQAIHQSLSDELARLGTF